MENTTIISTKEIDGIETTVEVSNKNGIHGDSALPMKVVITGGWNWGTTDHSIRDGCIEIQSVGEIEAKMLGNIFIHLGKHINETVDRIRSVYD